MFSSALKSLSSNITANYTLSANPTAIAGAWRVFDGKNKKNGKAVSVFVFDRKSLEPPGGSASLRGRSDAASRRKVHDEVVERLKKEASSLARLRHPNVLELAEPVEDTRNGGLMFATEPVTTTLAGLLQSEDEKQQGRSRSSRYNGNDDASGQAETAVDELEIQKGLLQVAKGLEFLHESARLVHGNLTPESIFINHKSDWKLSGMAFSGPPDDAPYGNTSAFPPIALSELLYYDPRLPRIVQLNLDYTSPDFVMDSQVCRAADMFSLGVLIISLYNSPHESPLHTSGNTHTYKKLFSSPSTAPSPSNNYLCQKTLPRDLIANVLPRLITRRPSTRMSARVFQESAFFDNILVSAIRFLESFPAKTPNEKSQFLRGLPRVLDQFPTSVLDRKVLPVLLEETKDKELLPLILGVVFKIVGLSSSPQRLFLDRIVPKLREVYLTSQTGKGGHVERDNAKEAGLAIVLGNMPLISENCTGKSLKDDILPIVHLGLESPTPALVDKALTSLTKILPMLDFSTIKNELFPVVAAVFSKTNSMAIKIRGLQAFSLLCGGSFGNNTTNGSRASSTILDKYTVQEKIVPLLKAIKTKEPAVMMAALKVLKQIGGLVDIDFLAMDVLPILWSFSLGPLLNLQQFQEYIVVIRGLSSKIEHEQTRKLRDLASKSANGLDASSQSNGLMSMDEGADLFAAPASTSTTDFERLVLGKGGGTDHSQSSTTLTNPFAAHPGTPSSLSPSVPWSSNAGSFATEHSSRAITPDSSLSSIAALPSRPLQPTLQPALQPAAAANPWASPPQTGNGAAGISAVGNPWVSPPQQSLNGAANGAWGRPPIAPSSNSMSNLTSMGSLNSVNAAPMRPTQSTMQSNSFNLAPPPGAGAVMSGSKPPAPPQGRKTGLDAYESLI